MPDTHTDPNLVKAISDVANIGFTLSSLRNEISNLNETLKAVAKKLDALLEGSE
jgi:hypothetical protein